MTELLRGIDLSNLQGHPDTWSSQSWYSTYQAADFAIIQALEPPIGYPGHDFVDPETGKRGYTGVALRRAVADGKKVGAYVWLWNYFATSVATKTDIANRLATIADSVRLDMRLWLDMEDTTQDHGPARQQDVLDALEVMDAWSTVHGLPLPGVYSGDWYLRGYMDAWFPMDRMYWIADYVTAAGARLRTGIPLHQFTSQPVDQNVMLQTEVCSVTDTEQLDGLISALGYVAGDLLRPVVKQKSLTTATKKLVAGIRMVADQQGIVHA